MLELDLNKLIFRCIDCPGARCAVHRLLNNLVGSIDLAAAQADVHRFVVVVRDALLAVFAAMRWWAHTMAAVSVLRLARTYVALVQAVQLFSINAGVWGEREDEEKRGRKRASEKGEHAVRRKCVMIHRWWSLFREDPVLKSQAGISSWWKEKGRRWF